MFRCRQKLFTAPFCSMVEFEPIADEDNKVHNKMVDLSEVRLPEPDAYDLGLLLKAGIPLQKVNTKVLSGDLQAGLEAIDNLTATLNKEGSHE